MRDLPGLRGAGGASRAAWLLSAILLVWGGGLLALGDRQSPDPESVGGVVAIRIFAPATPPPWAALVCVHSVFQDPDTAEAPARAAARAGVMGVQVLLSRGRTFEDHVEDLGMVIRRLEEDPRVSEIGLYGHSMGADVVCTSPGAEPAIAAGFPVEGGGRPRLMLAVGAWDELHPLAEMQQAASRAGAPLTVLPFADHAAETVSPDLFEAMLAFFPGVEARALRPDPFTARGLLALGLVLPFTWIAAQARGRRGPALAALVLCAAGLSLPIPGVAAGVTLAALVAASFPVLPPLRRVGILLALFGVALAVNSWGSLPRYGWGLPVFLAEAVPLAAARLGSSLVPLGRPSWLLGAWLLTELAFPGWLGRTASGVHDRLVRAVRSLDLRPRVAATPGTSLVLALCLGAAALAWREVARAGYFLEPVELLRLGGLFARLAMLPAVLLVICVRRGWWDDAPRR